MADVRDRPATTRLAAPHSSIRSSLAAPPSLCSPLAPSLCGPRSPTPCPHPPHLSCMRLR